MNEQQPTISWTDALADELKPISQKNFFNGDQNNPVLNRISLSTKEYILVALVLRNGQGVVKVDDTLYYTGSHPGNFFVFRAVPINNPVGFGKIEISIHFGENAGYVADYPSRYRHALPDEVGEGIGQLVKQLKAIGFYKRVDNIVDPDFEEVIKVRADGNQAIAATHTAIGILLDNQLVEKVVSLCKEHEEQPIDVNYVHEPLADNEVMVGSTQVQRMFPHMGRQAAYFSQDVRLDHKLYRLSVDPIDALAVLSTDYIRIDDDPNGLNHHCVLKIKFNLNVTSGRVYRLMTE